MAAGDNVVRVWTKAVSDQRLPVARQALRGDSHFRSAQVGDPATASRNQMLGRQSADGAVIDSNEAGAQTSDRTVNQNIGHVLLLHSFEHPQAAGRLRGRDDQPRSEE